MTPGFISKSSQDPKDSCEFLLRQMSVGSVWYDVWFCFLPRGHLKPTLQLAWRGPHSRPQTAGWREQGDGWWGRETERRSVGKSEGRSNETGSTLSGPAAPVALVTVRGWGFLAAAATSDVRADICPSCLQGGGEVVGCVFVCVCAWGGVICGAALHDTGSNGLVPQAAPL